MDAISRQSYSGFLLWSLTIISLLLAFTALYFTYDTDYSWIGHAVTGVTGLVLIIVVIANGLAVAGRLKGGTAGTFQLHKSASLLFSAFIVGTFIFGLWLTYSHSGVILSSIHGWLGLAIVFIALIQVAFCFTLKRQVKAKPMHLIIGLLIAVLVVIQTALGLEIALVVQMKPIVLVHSTFGAIAALALVWIILELRHLTPKGVARLKIAAIVAAFFNIVGCWIVGGYYYLTVYSSQLKPIVVGGPEPWVHDIVMETKEHVFLFLPIISLTLMLVLFWLSKDETLLKGPKERRAMLALAAFALIMVILTFVFGALISNAINIVGGGV